MALLLDGPYEGEKNRQYYGGSVAWRHAADIRATEVPKDYEVKARKADREFSGVEYVRNVPPGPVLALLRSMPPAISIVVGARRGLSHSVNQFLSECAAGSGRVHLPSVSAGVVRSRAGR